MSDSEQLHFAVRYLVFGDMYSTAVKMSSPSNTSTSERWRIFTVGLETTPTANYSPSEGGVGMFPGHLLNNQQKEPTDKKTNFLYKRKN